MAKQTINPGVAPTGAGGDTFRSGSAKLQANDDELYNYLGDGTNLNKLGTAAFKNTGTQAGNVMEVGAFGLGVTILHNVERLNQLAGFQGLSASATGFSFPLQCVTVGWSVGVSVIGVSAISKRMFFGTFNPNNPLALNTGWVEVRHSGNTAIDANGFLKNASPIVQLFADKVELNDEAQQQSIEFQKLGVGDYLIKGSSGFAQEGWYIETPKDANGNLLVAVVYEQLENGDISVKTYDYMLNKKGRIVADTETPLDIPKNRWIDLRLQELPQPESITPPELQPTGLAQAVATVMESYHDPEQ